MTELKECPCCGSTDISLNDTAMPFTGGEGMRIYAVVCEKCGLSTPNRTRRERAITAWNTRAYDTEMATLKSNLEAVTDMYRSAERELSQYKDAMERGELVRVVHCKECRHLYHGWGCGNDQWEAEGCYHPVKSDDYCSYGEHAEAAMEKEGQG